MSTLLSSFSNMESFDELKNKLVCTNLELESARSLLTQERIKSHEILKHSLSLLRAAWQERDEALTERDEARKDLHALLNKITELKPLPSDHHDQDHDLQSIPNLPDFVNFYTPIEYLNNISDTSEYKSAPTLLSPTKALPNLSNNNVPGFSDSTVISPGTVDNRHDRASVKMDRLLAKGIALPKKGKLLQAVVEAGPLLQTLLLAPTPKWENPPPIHLPNNSFQFSPFPSFLNATTLPSPPQAMFEEGPSVGFGAGFSHVP